MTADLDCWGQLGPPVEWGDRSRIRYGRNVMSWALPPSKYNAQEDTDWAYMLFDFKNKHLIFNCIPCHLNGICIFFRETLYLCPNLMKGPLEKIDPSINNPPPILFSLGIFKLARAACQSSEVKCSP